MLNQKLKQISDTELHTQTLQAAAGEKSATLILLEHLAEVDDRRLHASLGYSSLWEYACKALGFSESQASERVNSMRLTVRVPEVKKSLQEGQLSLTVVSKLATHVRREKLHSTETLELLKSVSGKPTREVERILAADCTEPARTDRVKVITAETTRITVDVDSEFMELMNRVKELKGNPALSAQDVFKTALKEFVKRREVKPVFETVTAPPTANEFDALTGRDRASRDSPSLRAQKVFLPQVRKNSRYIPVAIKHRIRRRSGDRCEYLDLLTQRRCESRSGLQFDHIVPYAKGGPTREDNLRHFCGIHNRLSAVHHFGKEKLDRFRAVGGKA